MVQSIVAYSPAHVPKELADCLGHPALVGDESVEDYNAFFSLIASAAKPLNAIEWLYIKDVVDLNWQIRRERAILVSVIKLHQKDAVLACLKSMQGAPTDLSAATYRIFDAAEEARQWASDPKARRQINKMLEEDGYSVSEILAKAYLKGAREIDGFERRIESYERRRATILRDTAVHRKDFAADLGQAASEVIDAEFSEDVS